MNKKPGGVGQSPCSHKNRSEFCDIVSNLKCGFAHCVEEAGTRSLSTLLYFYTDKIILEKKNSQSLMYIST